MNKLNEMDIANLSEKEIDTLEKYEKELNSLHNGDDIYLLALKK